MTQRISFANLYPIGEFLTTGTSNQIFHYIRLGLYKVEFRILEIRISGETNLKKHFLSGNWIRKKIFWAEKTFEFWISAEDSL